VEWYYCHRNNKKGVGTLSMNTLSIYNSVSVATLSAVYDTNATKEKKQKLVAMVLWDVVVVTA
jgi:lambda repressor-like predicted transcriptional regulator